MSKRNTNIALFDFDGTITTEDTFSSFVKTAIHPARKILGGLILFPFILGYKAKIISGTSVRKKVVFMGLAKRNYDEVKKIGVTYSKSVVEKLIRKNALDRIEWHLENGDKVVVVSASLKLYLLPWCEKHNVDLICSELEEKNGVLTGKYLNGDCTGVEKSRRVTTQYDLSSFEKIYAYGDTEEDNELLSLADEKYFRWKHID